MRGMDMREGLRRRGIGWLPLVCGAIGLLALPLRGDEEGRYAAAEIDEPEIDDVDRDHWAFRPLAEVAPPQVDREEWIRNDVDRFILARLEEADLQPMPPADKTTLIRRVTFNLTGLPPTPEEIDQFLADERPDAWEQLIDRLLESPAYGERWAQHWLDLARFAETDGFEHDLVRPNAWRYRDWVIDALNADMPYDEFVQRQIAGDLIDPDDPSAAIPTGFLLCGPDMPDINLQEERRHDVLNEMAGTVGAVFLGLQVGCAQCHNHMNDPISQADFYRLRAFFASAELFREQPVPTPEQQEQRRQQLAANAPRVERLERQVRQAEEAARAKLREENPDLQPDDAQLLSALDDAARQTLENDRRELERLRSGPPLPRGRVVRQGEAHRSFVMLRGDFRRPGPEIAPAFVRIAVAAQDPDSTGPEANDDQSSQDASLTRLDLAAWLTEPDNALATRVIVNRLWHHHFGQPLVGTPNDFGVMGDLPSHPELLDWLAAEFPRRDWSFKQMHRLLLRSSVYQQASRPAEPQWTEAQRAEARAAWSRSQESDPTNRFLARMNRQRLDGEAIRDAMLAIAGTISPRSGGPGVRPPLPPELVSTLLANQWNVAADEEDHRRRSVYLFVRRNLRFPLFEAFDRPDTHSSCPRRNRSTIAPQALVLMNSTLSLDSARSLVRRIDREGPQGATDLQIREAYRRVLGRLPSAEEKTIAAAFLQRQSAALASEGDESAPALTADEVPEEGDPRTAALTDLCLALFNLNEFIYLD